MKKNKMRLLTTDNLQLTTKKRAFTLIELLVVVAIIGVLAAIVILNLDKSQARSRDARRQADMDALMKATRMYFTEKHALPANYCGGSSCVVGSAHGGNVALNEVQTAGYLPNYPVDPKPVTAGSGYNYFNYTITTGGWESVTFKTIMEAPRRYGPFPYGWNCGIDTNKGWWAGMACDNVPVTGSPNRNATCRANPAAFFAPGGGFVGGETIITQGENIQYCTGFLTK